jgi:DsbC/DsbD-like thiol-disulfide interchange protein
MRASRPLLPGPFARPNVQSRCTPLILFVGLLGCQDRAAVDAPSAKRSAPPAAANGPARATVPSTTIAPPLNDAPPPEEPTDAKPVVVAAAIEPATAAPGATVTLIVRARIAPAWHIYASGNAGSTGMPTRLELSLPDGLEPDGDWQNPEPNVRPTSLGPEYILQGEAIFRRPLRIAAAATSGRLEAACTVTYQACNQSRCLLPVKADAAAALIVTPPKE